MRLLQTIKTILFADAQKQASFMEAANRCSPPIPGLTFDEKLFNLFHHASEENVQTLLAKILREKVYQYLANPITEFAQKFTKDHIQVAGEQIYNQQIQALQSQEMTSPAFDTMRNKFITTIGTATWEKLLTSPAATDIDAQNIYQRHKSAFLLAHSEPQSSTASNQDSTTLWDRIHCAAPAIQHFDSQKSLFITAWGEDQWNACTNMRAFTPIEALRSTEINADQESEEDSLGLPTPPSPTVEFLQLKHKFIAQYGESTWENAQRQSNFPIAVLKDARHYKQQIIQEIGIQRWERLYLAPLAVREFDAIKDTFIKKWNRQIWDIYSGQDSNPSLSPNAKQCLQNWCMQATDSDLYRNLRITFENAQRSDTWYEFLNQHISDDLLQRKNQYRARWLDLGMPQAWEEVSNYPEIPSDSLELLMQYRQNFVETWGKIAWIDYLNLHRNSAEFATDDQLIVLAELFDFKLEVTDIRSGQRRTTMLLRANGNHRVHFFCEDNIHFYIHENGYEDTSGEGNNCAYNGFAQWLKLLVLGQPARRAVVLHKNVNSDPEIYAFVQAARLREMDVTPTDDIQTATIVDTAIQPFLSEEEITIQLIRKELHLPLDHSKCTELANFLKNKANALCHIINVQKLPSNRIAILEKIVELSAIFAQQNNHAALITLQQLLLFITNTVYLPNTRDVQNWTREEFEANIRELPDFVATKLQATAFQTLNTMILNTDFKDKTHYSNTCLNSFLALTPGASPYRRPQSVIPTLPPENDWLSTILYMSGIFILIAGMISLTSLLLLMLLSGPTHLGLLLMQSGWQMIANSLGGMIGLSAPYTAVMTAHCTAVMISGLGFTLFKDFAPRNGLDYSPELTSNRKAC
jgi:hypothetical protein